MASVELRHVSKRFGDTIAVDDFDLVVEDREFMVLLGPSGCGKSTVLRMIAGLEDPTAGDVLIDGKRVNDLAPKERDVAMVFQNYALYPHMTVFDNMAFGLKMRRIPRDEIAERVRAASRILELSDLFDRKPAQLSGGQRQRVALGRAIVRNPKVFLFDEPLSNLDAKLRNQTRAELARLHQQLQTTMIYVTHDQVEAMTMGQRIAALENGRAQQVDVPLELYKWPANLFVAGFIGSPAMNLFRGQARDGELDCGTFRIPLPPRLRDRRRAEALTFGIRPEHLGFEQNGDTSITFSGKVELIEPLGAVTYAHVRVDKQLVAARVAAGTTLDPDSRVRLHFDPASGHFFESDTGLRID